MVPPAGSAGGMEHWRARPRAICTYNPAAVTPPNSNDLITFSREKPRRLYASLGYRAYRLLSAVVPKRGLLKLLLEADRLVHQYCWEHARILLAEGTVGARMPSTVRDLMIEHVPVGSTVLDLGGGPGNDTALIAPRASRVVYVDHDLRKAARARERHGSAVPNATSVAGDALAVMREHGPFDIALLNNVLEHIDEPVAVLTELRRNCGALVIIVPDFGCELLNFVRLEVGTPCYGDDDHVTEFTADSLRHCLEQAGWQADPLVAVNGLLFVRARFSETPAALSHPRTAL
jgi:protein-L-isoaspartate O-methyltransferase